MQKGKEVKTYNPIAHDLRSPKYAPRIVRMKTIYNRKKKENNIE